MVFIIKDFKLKHEDILPILILLCVSIVLTVKNIYFNRSIGIFCSDVFLYLIDSLNYAGLDINVADMTLSPVITYLTSILFRFGFSDEISIFIVTGVFAIFGSLGFYIFLKERFNPLLSLCGSIFLYTISLNMVWLATGSLDAPAIGFSIWTFLFFKLGVDRNSKYFLISWIFLVLSFFIRYTTLLILPAIVIYILKDLRRDLKYHLFGVFLAFLLFIFVLRFLNTFNVSSSFIFLQFLDVNNGFSNATFDNAYTSDTWFYLKNFLNFLYSDSISLNFAGNPTLESPSILSYFLCIFMVLALVFKSLKVKKFKNISKFYLLCFIVSGIFSILGFSIFNSLTHSIVLFLNILCLRKVLESFNFKYLDLNIAMLMWVLINFTIFTHISLKVNRYILTVMPAFIYFFILSIDGIKFKDYNISKFLSILLICAFLFYGFTYTDTVSVDSELKSPELISKYLTSQEDFNTSEIGVYNKRPYSWYLKKYTWGITDENRDYLEKEDTITYYIVNKEVNLRNFNLIKKEGKINLYKRIN